MEFWRIENGAITGGTLTEKVARNQYLRTKKEYGDFELRLEFKLVGVEATNGGVDIRAAQMQQQQTRISQQQYAEALALAGCDSFEPLRNFSAVEDGVLYRSGRLEAPALRRAIEEHGLKTVAEPRPIAIALQHTALTTLEPSLGQAGDGFVLSAVRPGLLPVPLPDLQLSDGRLRLQGIAEADVDLRTFDPLVGSARLALQPAGAEEVVGQRRQ